MDILSDEILMNIFELVPTRTRRESVRLVCKKWNRIYQSLIFVKDESIICLHVFNLILAQHLGFHQRKILNLHFVYKSFLWSDTEISFWKEHGERVMSIHLTQGNFNFVDVKKITEFCPNLRSVKLQCLDALSHWLYDFDAFASMNYRANSVTTFHFHVQKQYSLTDFKLQKILATFPNLTDVGLQLTYPVHSSFGSKGFPLSDEKLTCSGIFSIFSGMAKNLKELCFKSDYVLEVNRPAVLTLLTQLENVKELQLSHLILSVDRYEEPFKHLLKLTKITSLSLGILPVNYSAAKFISLVLNAFVNLRRLYLDLFSNMEIDDISIQKLISSGLKTLHLGFDKLILSQGVKQCDFSGVNRTLETVSIFRRENRSLLLQELANLDSDVEDDNAFLISLFPQYFQNVNDVTVSRANDKILQHIFKYQERLRKLRLENCSSCTDFGFTGISDSVTADGEITYCISELSNLEYFRIDPANRVTEKTFAYFVLPKLKTLELLNFKHSNMSLYLFQTSMRYLAKFEFLIENSLFLEELRLSLFEHLPTEELEKIIRPFKFLRYVNISEKNTSNTITEKSNEPECYYKYEHFFEICPSLRKFVYNQILVYINPLTKKLEAQKHSDINEICEHFVVLRPKSELVQRWTLQDFQVQIEKID